MRIIHKAKLVYVNPPRTGTNITGRSLENHFKTIEIPDKSRSGHATIWKPEWNSYYVFITVRHPFTRAISLWRRGVEFLKYRDKETLKILRNGKASFTEMLHHPGLLEFWTGMPCVSFTDKVPAINCTVYQENLVKDLKQIPALNSGFKLLKQFSNISKDKTPWHGHYDQKDIDFVLDVFKGDFDQYGYERDIEAVKAGKYLSGS